ncbi:MAG: DUF1415 domain-containing protein [Hellea sp.]
MPNHNDLINHTKKWLTSVVIGHNFCPFAKREYEADTIHYAVVEATDLEGQLKQIILHCAALDNDETRETSLLIFPKALSQFETYLDMLGVAASLLKDQGYEGIYQLASFHPEYLFAGVRPDDASHFTNRSPYPMVHILREASVEAALYKYPNPEKIPERNINLTQELGAATMRALLAACYKF